MPSSNRHAYPRQNNRVFPWLAAVVVLVMITLPLALSVVQPTLAAAVTMTVYQQKDSKIFGQNTSLDIFNHPKLGGKKLLAPFSHGSYTFVVNNTSNSQGLPYALMVTTENPEDLPIVGSLQKNGTYVFGSEGDAGMLPMKDMTMGEVLLSGGKADSYTFNWRWNTESDEKDTAIGNAEPATYALTITAIGTIPETEGPNTGDHSMLMWVTVAATFGLLTLLLLVYRRRREKEEAEA